MSTELRHITLRGQNLAYLEEGDGPLVLLLHGFPDSARSFDGLRAGLVQAGYRTVAPWLRGYHPTGPVADGDYSVAALAGDVVAFMEALAPGEKTRLIGHDWGGFAATAAAALAPQHVERLVVLGVPHMHVINFSLSQIRRSWYVWLFQLPLLAERLLPRDDFAFIDGLYRRWSPRLDPDRVNLRAVKEALGGPGSTAAAIAYYRSLMRGHRRSWRLLRQKTTVPSLWFAGGQDGSLDPGQFRGIEGAFDDAFELVMLEEAGHFMHLEEPETILENILGFFP